MTGPPSSTSSVGASAFSWISAANSGVVCWGISGRGSLTGCCYLPKKKPTPYSSFDRSTRSSRHASIWGPPQLDHRWSRKTQSDSAVVWRSTVFLLWCRGRIGFVSGPADRLGLSSPEHDSDLFGAHFSPGRIGSCLALCDSCYQIYYGLSWRFSPQWIYYQFPDPSWRCSLRSAAYSCKTYFAFSWPWS